MKEYDDLLAYLKKDPNKKQVLLTTSNRWEGEKQAAKSTLLAQLIQKELPNCKLLDVSKLTIFQCEGNVSSASGNKCGVLKSAIKDKTQNPTGEIRCWASVNNKEDEMYKAANLILEADQIVFFGSIRWGKINAVYTRLIERLTWLENRHTTLNEPNILEGKEAGVIAIGHNFNGKEAIQLEKQVLQFFGFKTPTQLSFSYQYTKDSNKESLESYKKARIHFFNVFKIKINEAFKTFNEWLTKP